MIATQPEALDIIKGKIVTKAILQLENKVHIIVVFNTSMMYKFFFHFEAPSAKTPRRQWKYTKQYHILFGDNTIPGKPANHTIKSYADQQARLLHASKVTVRNHISAKRVKEFFELIAHPPVQSAPAGATFNVASNITSGTTHKITRLDRAQAWASWNEAHNR